MRRFLLLFLSFFLFLACSTDKDEEDYATELTVASERILNCDVFTYGRPYLLVKEPGDKTWRRIPGILGFDYKRGYEYKLKVRVHMTPDLMDAPDREYTLVKIVGKDEKQSGDLPAVWTKWDDEWNGQRIPCKRE